MKYNILVFSVPLVSKSSTTASALPQLTPPPYTPPPPTPPTIPRTDVRETRRQMVRGASSAQISLTPPSTPTPTRRSLTTARHGCHMFSFNYVNNVLSALLNDPTYVAEPLVD